MFLSRSSLLTLTKEMFCDALSQDGIANASSSLTRSEPGFHGQWDSLPGSLLVLSSKKSCQVLQFCKIWNGYLGSKNFTSDAVQDGVRKANIVHTKRSACLSVHFSACVITWCDISGFGILFVPVCGLSGKKFRQSISWWLWWHLTLFANAESFFGQVQIMLFSSLGNKAWSVQFHLAMVFQNYFHTNGPLAKQVELFSRVDRVKHSPYGSRLWRVQHAQF